MAFLKANDIVRKRTQGSHAIYDRPDDSLSRPIVVVPGIKVVPETHLHTNLRTMGKTTADLRRWLAGR